MTYYSVRCWDFLAFL
jgi:hypothetical protein